MKKSVPRWRKWLRRAFLAWAVFVTGMLAYSIRTKGVEPALLESSSQVAVVDGEETLQFLPTSSKQVGLVFVCGAGVAAEAYAPLLRPIAEAGYSVFVIRLPLWFAPFESHKLEAIARVRQIVAERQDIERWVLSGHSLGGALSCRVVRADPKPFSALALLGTTHPKRFSLASLELPVLKVYGAEDGVAPVHKVHANRELLPTHTRWVMIEGGNHSQFGHYGPQLLDGSAAISRSDQQDQARRAILELLDDVSTD